MKVNKLKLVFIFFLGICVLLVGGGYLVAFPTIPQPKNSKTNTVFWDAKLSHPYFYKGSDEDILINFHIKGQEVKYRERAPVNLVLVIDRSGSMGEVGKLEYAKEAAKRIISDLGSNDRIGIVGHSTQVGLS